MKNMIIFFIMGVILLCMGILFSNSKQIDTFINPGVTSTPNSEYPFAGMVTTDSNNVPMVFVPGGTFLMGMDVDDAVDACVERIGIAYADLCFEDVFYSASPAHEVSVDSFWLDQYEVTWGEWQKCVDDNVCSDVSDFKLYVVDYTPSLPFSRTTFDMATQYCEWRGSRLPTEAEWEYAARGPENLIYPWGNVFRGEYTNIRDLSLSDDYPYIDWDDGYRLYAPVGSFPMDKSWVNAYDLLGNVAEHVAGDIIPYPNFSYHLEQESLFNGEINFTTLVRGGAYTDQVIYISNSGRTAIEGDFSNSTLVGFRCARTNDPRLSISQN